MEETSDFNEFIEPYNYFEGYNESIQKLKNNPEAISFERLCYEVFEGTQDGKDLMKLIDEKFLMAARVDINHPNYLVALADNEGMRKAFRLLKQCVISHKQRIQAEVNK